MKISKLVREPLVHFFLLGAALFALHALFGQKPREPTTSDRIVIDAARREELAARYAEANGRAPSSEELEREVERWVDEEVLFREGVARGLDRDDPGVRQRVASKMVYVLEAKLALPEPTPVELERWFAEHRQRFRQPARVDFVHVFVEGRDAAAATRAHQLLGELANGADPDRLGDRFSGGRHYRDRKLEDLDKSFGPEFVAGLDAQPAGEWRLRRSRYGLHCVRIERHQAAEEPSLERVRLDVIKAWKDEQLARERARAVADLRRRFVIEGAR